MPAKFFLAHGQENVKIAALDAGAAHFGGKLFAEG